MPLGKVGSPQDTLTEVVVSSLKWMKLGALGAAGMQRSEVNRRGENVYCLSFPTDKCVQRLCGRTCKLTIYTKHIKTIINKQG